MRHKMDVSGLNLKNQVEAIDIMLKSILTTVIVF